MGYNRAVRDGGVVMEWLLDRLFAAWDPDFDKMTDEWISKHRFRHGIIKRLVLAWDPDYIKLTKREAEELRVSRQEYANGEFISHADIDWDNLDRMDLD
jgi:hypothetical protein